MKIYFNSLGVVTSTDFTGDSLRQGSVGIELNCFFDDVNNVNYTATLNFTRSDNSSISGVIMTLNQTNSERYDYKFNDPWFFAKSGTTTLTIYLHDANGNVIAQGQVTFSIEATDYDGNPTITITQYNALLALIQALSPTGNPILILDTLPDAQDYTDGQVIYVNSLNNFYKLDDGQWVNALNIVISPATSSALGLVKLASDTVVAADLQPITTESGKTYGVQVNSDGKLCVNVPWAATGWDTWRNVKINGNDLLSTSTGSGALDLRAGSNISITKDGLNRVYFAATDTKYTAGSDIAINGSNEISLSSGSQDVGKVPVSDGNGGINWVSVSSFGGVYRHKITMTTGQYGTVTAFVLSSASSPYSDLAAFMSDLANIGPINATYVVDSGTPSEILKILLIMYHATNQKWTIWDANGQTSLSGDVWSNFSDTMV